MTTKLLETYADLIQQYAKVALQKLKKPTICNLDDLCQEGVVAFFNAQNSYDISRGTAFKTWLVTCLKQHFSDLVIQSYRKKETSSDTIQSRSRRHYDKFINSINTFEIVQIQFLLKNFSKDEINYIDMMISLVNINRRSRRKLTRQALNISFYREMALRKSIYAKIKK